MLERALQPYPTPVRTLDALHLASALFLVERGEQIELATYDRRTARASRAVGVPLYRLEKENA